MRLPLVLAVILLAYHTQADSIKTARHAYASSASGSHSNAFAGSFASGAGIKAEAAAGNGPFWWAGNNSPFKDAYEYFQRCSLKGNCGNIPGPFAGLPVNIPNNVPDNSCNGNGCSFSGGFNIHDKPQGGHISSELGPINIAQNPFLNGEYKGVAISSCSGNACPGGKPHSTITTTECKGPDCKTNTQHGSAPSDLSGNPFLSGSGAFGSTGSQSGNSGCAGVKGGCSGSGGLPGTGCSGAGGCGSSSGSYSGSFGGSTGIGGSSGSYPGSSGQTTLTGTTSQQGIPTTYPGQQGGHQPTGCSGVTGGCGGSTGSYSGHTSFTGTAGSGSSQQGIPNSYPGQQGGCSGSSCAGGSTSFTGSTGSSGATGSSGHTSFTGTTGQQGIPTTYPGQQGGCSGSSCAGGSTSFTGSTGSSGTTGSSGHTSFTGQQGIPTTYPGQQGGCSGSSCAGGSTSFTGSTGSSGHTSFTGTTGQQGIPTTYPGQQGGCSGNSCAGGSTSYTGSTGSSGSSGHTSFTGTTGQQGIPTTYPGQQGGCSGSGCAGGSSSFGGSTGSSGHTSFTGTTVSGSSQQGIPTTYPSQQTFPQTGSGSHSTSGSFGGNSYPSQNQNIPSSLPDVIDYSKGVQPIPTDFPDSQHTQLTSGSSSGSFGSTDSKNSGSQHGQTTGTFGSQPSYTGGTPQGQSTTGSFGVPSYTAGSPTSQTGFGGSNSFSTAGSFAGSGSTTGQFSGKTTPAVGDYASTGNVAGQPDAKCYGQGLTCVKKHLCVNGFVNNNGDGLLQVRDGNKYCDVNTEICCRVPGSSNEPHKDINLQLPNGPGSQSIYTTSSHKSSSAAASSSSSNTASSSSTFITNGPNPTDLPTRFSPSGSNPGVTGYQPGSTSNQPGATSNQPGFTSNQQPGSFQPGSGFNQPGSSNYQPGQTIPFGGKAGTSPGVIQVVPDAPSNGKTVAPDLLRVVPEQTQSTNQPGVLTRFSPGETPKSPGLTHILPNGDVSTPRGELVHVYPNGQGSTLRPGVANDYKDVTNELSFASTIKGPAYLPPGPSPSPSPSSYSPDLIPPNRPTNSQQTSTRFDYSPTTPKPNNYYPTSPPQTTRYQQTTPAYLPPYSGSQTGGFVSSTKNPQGYLPPNEIPSATNGNNEYLSPPDNEQPDSNIINISVVPKDPPTKKPPTDRDPLGTNPRETFLRPNPPRTEYPLNTTPYPGCAAALKCVLGEFCTAEGVISPTIVRLTKEQEINRVPLTECQDPEQGIIGKCCRDPDYKDPWPSTQLGLFNPDQEGQGSNNGQYKETGNNGKYNPGVKGRRPAPVPGPFNPYEANQIGSPSNNPNAVIRPGGYPTNIPNIPFDSRLINVPVRIDVQPPVETDFNQKYPTSASKINGENCGVRHPDSKPVGPGPIDASFAEIPWQAMILRDTNRSLLCGGAIIRRDVILTAAHCVENLQAHDVLVKGGEWKLGIDEEPKPFQINKVSAIVRHPGYRPENKLNDVALLILEDKFRLDRNLDTLCLPSPGEDVAKTFQKAKCITTGWGKTTLQLNIVNSVMHILGVGIVSGNQCQQQLQQSHSDSAYLYNTNCVCGAPVQPQADICDVDVGSALACDRGDGRYTLAGIYSWDTGCNPTAQIAGYSKIDTQWVESTLQRPIKDLKTEETGFYAQLQGQDCHCLPGK